MATDFAHCQCPASTGGTIHRLGCPYDPATRGWPIQAEALPFTGMLAPRLSDEDVERIADRVVAKLAAGQLFK